VSTDKIEITYVEFDRDAFKEAPCVGSLWYVEWRRNGVKETAYADPDKSAHRGLELLPDDVRVALALLVAPGLVEMKR
jgi:hypothetical protein